MVKRRLIKDRITSGWKVEKNGSKSARIASTTNLPSAPECCACCWHRQEPFRIKYLKLRKMHSSYFHVHYCRSYCNHNDCRFYRFLPLLRIMGHGFMCLSVWIPISLSLSLIFCVPFTRLLNHETWHSLWCHLLDFIPTDPFQFHFYST